MQIKKKEVLLKEIIKILDDNKAKDIVTINLAKQEFYCRLYDCR